MGSTGWIIRIYPHDDYSKTLDFVGNYKVLKDRQEDELIVFRGIYGLDAYLIWDVFQNLPHYDFGRASLDLRLFLEGNTKAPFFTDQFKVIDVKYDPKTSRYRVFAISHDSATLQSLLTDYDVTSLSYSENRTPKQVLIDVLQERGEEENKIFDVEFHEHPQQEEHRNFEYRSLTINNEWRVLDFINYIADQNEFEWLVRGGTLYIGKELFADVTKNSTKPFDIGADKEAKSPFFKMILGPTRPMDALSHINKEWRCIWTKHWAGKSGGNSEGCFVRIGSGTVDKELYFRTLRGIIEKTLATRLLNQKLTSHSVMLGSILKDEGSERFIDSVSIQKNKELFKINTPENVKIDRKDSINTKEKIARTTPYLDEGSGLLFPSMQLGNIEPPNSIVFNIEGKEESSALGPFIMGKNGDLAIPAKDLMDFRLQFPNGWCLYVKESGDTILQVEDTDDQTIPDELEIGKQGLHLIVENEQGNREFVMGLDTSNFIEFKNSDEGFKVLAEGTVYLSSDKNMLLQVNGDDNIEIISISGKTLIQGGGHTLAWKNHDHIAPPATDCFGAPLLGNVAPNTQGTTNTEAD
ncbi:MAG: hypothetical protein V3V14_08370 [Saprospiraceae bacterium]